VNITELRSRLRICLSRVRGGEELLIRDRNHAIAKIVPLSTSEAADEDLLELAARGQIRLPEKSLDFKSFLALPAPAIPVSKLKAAIEAEREES